MSKAFSLLALVLCALSAVQLLTPTWAVPGLRDRVRQRHETTTTTELPTTTRAPPYEASVIVNRNIPHVEPGCNIHFDCKKKLKNAAQPKPCVKFCVKNIICVGRNETGKPGECFEVVEEHVKHEHDIYVQELAEERRKKAESSPIPTTSTAVPIMEVAMIDFPCQPGYLPDSRGRCREVW